MPTPPTALHTLSLHDALPIWSQPQDLSRKAGRQIHLPLASEKQPAREAGKLPFLDVFSVAIEELDSAILDRKSTRLNSSHTVISYAVFCLKKKIYLHKHTQDR